VCTHIHKSNTCMYTVPGTCTCIIPVYFLYKCRGNPHENVVKKVIKRCFSAYPRYLTRSTRTNAMIRRVGWMWGGRGCTGEFSVQSPGPNARMDPGFPRFPRFRKIRGTSNQKKILNPRSFYFGKRQSHRYLLLLWLIALIVYHHCNADCNHHQ